MQTYDIIIIGGGPAGCAGALRARELGFKTLLIEKELLGGVCLHAGCIPTKALLATASLIDKIRRAPEFGLEARLEAPSLPAIISRKNEIVKTLAEGLSQGLTRKGVDVVRGHASFEKANVVTILASDSSQREFSAKNIIIATGSRPQELLGIPFDGKTVLSSNDILSLPEAPKRLGIIGGGVIGCEFASFFASLGTEVTIVEMLPQLISTEDKDIAKRLEVLFKRRGIRIHLGKKLDRVSVERSEVSCFLDGNEKITCEKLLVAVGRKRNTDKLALEKAGLKTDKGALTVNEFLETSVPGIFAVGDVIGSPQLAHVAQAEALLVVENMKRTPRPMDYRGWPNTIFTHPEVASTGLTREKAELDGVSAAETRTLYGVLGKSHVERETDGFIKLVFDAKSGQILGGHIIGDRASDLIAEISLAVRLKATREDLVNTIHAHPTFSEIVWEAARAAGPQ